MGGPSTGFNISSFAESLLRGTGLMLQSYTGQLLSNSGFQLTAQTSCLILLTLCSRISDGNAAMEQYSNLTFATTCKHQGRNISALENRLLKCYSKSNSPLKHTTMKDEDLTAFALQNQFYHSPTVHWPVLCKSSSTNIVWCK